MKVVAYASTFHDGMGWTFFDQCPFEVVNHDLFNAHVGHFLWLNGNFSKGYLFAFRLADKQVHALV